MTVADWQKLLNERQIEHARRLDDFEYRKTGDFKSTVLKNQSSLPGGLRVIGAVKPSDRQYFFGKWVGGEYSKNGANFYAFTYPLKDNAQRGEYSEVELHVPITGPVGWRGLRFFLNTWTNETIGSQDLGGRWLGAGLIQLKHGEDVLWQSDVAIRRGGGEWVTVGLPDPAEGQKEMTLTLRVQNVQGAYNFAAAVFIGPIQVVYVLA
jgi:hypothetical protein